MYGDMEKIQNKTKKKNKKKKINCVGKTAKGFYNQNTLKLGVCMWVSEIVFKLFIVV